MSTVNQEHMDVLLRLVNKGPYFQLLNKEARPPYKILRRRNAAVNDIKIVFFDIDGTLIDMNSRQISERMLETLKRLKERGIILCISTGRSPLALPQEIDADVYLTYNGSYCFHGRETILSNPIPNEDVKTIVANAAAIGRPALIATKDRMLANGKDEDLVEYISISRLDVVVAEDFDRVANAEEIYQIMVGCRESDYPALMRNVRHARITASWDRAVDIIPTNSGKGAGVKKTLAYYHLDKSEAIAFGDGDNDIDMLEAVGVGVAMANGSDRLKKTADDICGRVSEDGIYHYCAAHGLI